MVNWRLMAICMAVIGTAAFRVLPHVTNLPIPPNFAPVAAVSLFAGAALSSRTLALFLPLAAMFCSDVILGLVKGDVAGYAMHSQMPVVYLSYALIAGIGMVLKNRRRFLPIAWSTLAASVVFFAVTNFGVWALEDFYPRTPAGLTACFAAAVPFFGATLLSDAFFVAVLFGLLAAAESRIPALRPGSLPA